MEKIPEILKQVGYKHIPEEELIAQYNRIKDIDGVKMFSIDVDIDLETFEITVLSHEEYGKYLKRKERREKLEKINKNE